MVYTIQIRRPATEAELEKSTCPEFYKEFGELVASTGMVVEPTLSTHDALMKLAESANRLLGGYRWNHPVMIHVMEDTAWGEIVRTRAI